MHSEVHVQEQFLQSPDRARMTASAAVLLTIVWILGWNWQTTASIVTTWYRSETFAHGFVVVPIVLFLIWRDRESLSRIPVRPYPGALGGLVLAGFGWLVADLAAVLGGTQFMVVAMIPLAVWAILGTRMLRALAFPLGFLFFAVPFGEFVVPVLMDWTAEFTIAALRATGIPVLREGNNFSIPSGNWSVVEACSGVRYLIASVVVGVLYAYLTFRSFTRRAMFVGASILVPLVANWLRAYLIVMIGHVSSNRLAVGVDHLIYGWLFFGVVMLLLFWVAGFWREDLRPEPIAGSLGSSPASVDSAPHLLIVTLTALTVISIWRPIASVLESPHASRPLRLESLEPAHGWNAMPDAVAEFRPDFANPVAESSQTFAKGNAVVHLFVAMYRNQSQTSELISQNNQLVRTLNKNWTRVQSGYADALLGADAVRVRTAELRGVQDRIVARQWYWIGGRLTSSDFVGKAYLGMIRLLGRPDDSAVIVIFAPLNSSITPRDQALALFMAEMGDSIQRMLRESASK